MVVHNRLCLWFTNLCHTGLVQRRRKGHDTTAHAIVKVCVLFLKTCWLQGNLKIPLEISGLLEKGFPKCSVYL